MGRPRKENAMTSTESPRKYHLDPDKYLAGNKRKRDAQKLKPLTYPLNENELEKKRMTDHLRKSCFSYESITSKKSWIKTER